MFYIVICFVMKTVVSVNTGHTIKVLEEKWELFIGVLLDGGYNEVMVDPPNNKNGGKKIPQKAIIRKSECLFTPLTYTELKELREDDQYIYGTLLKIQDSKTIGSMITRVTGDTVEELHYKVIHRGFIPMSDLCNYDAYLVKLYEARLP